MAVMIQIRNVPSDLHRKLKARAALEGLSLSDYLLREVERLAERPTLQEIRARIEQRTQVRLRVGSVRAIRSRRDGR
jgi:plasmid stability protein